MADGAPLNTDDRMAIHELLALCMDLRHRRRGRIRQLLHRGRHAVRGRLRRARSLDRRGGNPYDGRVLLFAPKLSWSTASCKPDPDRRRGRCGNGSILLLRHRLQGRTALPCPIRGPLSGSGGPAGRPMAASGSIDPRLVGRGTGALSRPERREDAPCPTARTRPAALTGQPAWRVASGPTDCLSSASVSESLPKLRSASWATPPWRPLRDEREIASRLAAATVAPSHLPPDIPLHSTHAARIGQVFFAAPPPRAQCFTLKTKLYTSLHNAATKSARHVRFGEVMR
ncbi:MAG: hypothetical protein JWN66_4416 [Sphingomonas bacterium]|nr:hypothetical protein [Sphingomonas bacterium]